MALIDTSKTIVELFITWLISIPDIIWAAIAASGITLLGVNLANRSNRKCLKMQLTHTADENDKERKMSLRREVYLSAAKSIGQELTYLAGFYNTNVVLPEGYYEAIKQIDVIGNDETIAALNQFNDHILDAFIELDPKKSEIDLLRDRNNASLELMKQGIDLEENTQRHIKIFDKIIELTYDLAENCQQKAQLAEELLTPVIIAIRKEMSTPFDEAAYKSMMEASHKKWKENTERYTKTMKDTYSQEIQLFLKEINENNE